MTGIRDEPMCPICTLAISRDYLNVHLKIDHTHADVANALAIIALDDHEEWWAELKAATIVTPQE